VGFFADLIIALVATSAAAFFRYAIEDTLPEGSPFVTFLPCIIIIAFVFGTRAGVLTAVLSGLTAWYWFLPPYSSFSLDFSRMVALSFFVFTAATQITIVHWLQRSNGLLADAREANARLAQTRELLFRELQHRISNNLQMVAALLSIQRRQVSNDGARAALDEAARRLQTVGKISRQIYDPAGGTQPLGSFLDQLAREVIESSSPDPIRYEVTGDRSARVGPEAAIPLALVVAESIANAIEHGFAENQPDPMLDIRLTAMSPQRLTVEIEDNGRGLPEGFTLAASDSLGLRIATMLAQQMGAISPWHGPEQAAAHWPGWNCR
jgi:two-component sensor histidine kinase